MRPVYAVVLFVAISPTSFAQWSSDAATNLPVADGAETQVQPKIVPTADGGVYIAWYEGSGFDVRLQKLDEEGNEVFPHEGILVADRNFGSTQDYGLSVDAAGNALLTFRDDRQGGTQVTATLVTPTGTRPWGESGIQLTSTTDFLGAPKITGTSDGGSVVAWFQNGSTRVQKMDVNGVLQWTEDVVLTPTVGFYFTSDLHAHGTDAILSVVHQTGTGSAPRHLVTQKFDADGNALWGADPVAVFDGGSLQMGNFPTFVPDGTGGAIFSWYDVSTDPMQSYVQRMLANGTEAFAHNGLAVATTAGHDNVSPDVAFDPETAEIYAFWRSVEIVNQQDVRGLFGQKFDDTGARRWNDDGLEIVAPAANVDITSIQTVVGEPGALAFWSKAESFGQNQLFGVRASGDATDSIEVDVFDVSTTPSIKSRLAAVNTTEGFAALAWEDDRAANEDVYAQNVNHDGTLGLPIGIEDEASDSRLAIRAWPNPARDRVHFETALPSGRRGELTVCDILGRAVWGQPVRASGATAKITWDGRDSEGRQVAPGVYLVSLVSDDARRSISLTVVR